MDPQQPADLSRIQQAAREAHAAATAGSGVIPRLPSLTPGRDERLKEVVGEVPFALSDRSRDVLLIERTILETPELVHKIIAGPEITRASELMPYRMEGGTVLIAIDSCEAGFDPQGHSSGTEVIRQWPSRSDLYCAHCAYPYGTVPLPVAIEFIPGMQAYRIESCVCQASCMLSYLNREFPNHPRLEDLKKINMRIYITEFGLNPEKVALMEPAPPPHLTLRGFTRNGITIEEYRDPDLVASHTPLLRHPFVTGPVVLKANWSAMLRGIARDVILEMRGVDTSRTRHVRRVEEGCEEQELRFGSLVHDPRTGVAVVSMAEMQRNMQSDIRFQRRPEASGIPYPPNVHMTSAFEGDRDHFATLSRPMSEEETRRLSQAMQRVRRSDAAKNFDRSLMQELMEELKRHVMITTSEGDGGGVAAGEDAGGDAGGDAEYEPK